MSDASKDGGSAEPNEPRAPRSTTAFSLRQAPVDDYFSGFDGPDGFGELGEPSTLLDDARAFLGSAFAPKTRLKVAARVLPVVAMLIAGVMFWPTGSDEPEPSGLAIRTAIAGAPSVDPADDGPGLAVAEGTEDRLLFVEDADAPERGLSRLDTVPDESDTDADEADATSTTEDGAVDANGSTTTEASGAVVADGETDDRTTTTAASETTAPADTDAPTTPAPTTNPSDTEAPTTPAPTQPPTTPAPTTAPAPPPTEPPTTPAPTNPPPSNNCSGGGEFERVFRDDFNGSSVAGHWGQYNSTGNAGYGLRRSSANTVRDGKLVITARMQDGSLVSGGMQHNHGQTYGKYVFRVRTDNDPSQAVSGVVLTWPQSGVHPRDGENNIYETLVQRPERNPFFTFIHKPFGSTSDQEYKEHNADGSQWQTMTMEWTPSRITITREGPGRDGNFDSWTVNETGADLIPDNPHKLSIQLDGWKHSIQGEVKMELDFVEVHKYCG